MPRDSGTRRGHLAVVAHGLAGADAAEQEQAVGGPRVDREVHAVPVLESARRSCWRGVVRFCACTTRLGSNAVSCWPLLERPGAVGAVTVYAVNSVGPSAMLSVTRKLPYQRRK